MQNLIQRAPHLFFLLLICLLLGSILLALNVGKFPISPSQLWQTLVCSLNSQCDINSPIHTVLWQIRSPRIVVACLVGAALACAGATYQGMFKNPLVSPDILGVSAGAGFGASLAIFYNLPMFYIQLFAFLGGIATVFCVSLIATRSKGQDPILVLVLLGIAIGSLLGAGISLLKILADPFTQLPSITFWLLGSLTTISPQDVRQLAPILILGMVPLFLLRWRLNLLSLEEEEARSLGVPIKMTRYILIIFTTVCTASAVSITGIIGWVGLLVPHIARLLVGANFILLLPTSVLLGATFLLLTDTLARTIADIELPLGILTSACGAPFFLYLLLRGRR
ncbi:iron ABC transporter permease [Aggregatibacter actinomycetemcomitans]|uniref:FecCD family ABC transporter permease n=1 Tax=Aggregatibacter actinomycetemcomitans TaxID=714 RepID=UPI00197B6319|nr:iron ABC transporter permease [Aggregatibacter actinomycetemcomitans]MBN6082360.1 iron ABC transporter permease [Aggregatibacter actinomycetemcomitans]